MKRVRRTRRDDRFPRTSELLERRVYLAAELLGDLNTDRFPPGARDYTNVGDLTFFIADDGVHGQELFVTDRTAAGTRMVRDLVPGPDPSKPISLTPFEGELYFIALDEHQAYRLYRTDGTARGTTLVSGEVKVAVQYNADGSAITDAAFNPLAPRDVLRFFHRSGDVNGDGVVNISDYFAIDSGRARRASGYSNGDFDFSGGSPDADDYAIIDRAFLAQAGQEQGGGAQAVAGPRPLPGGAPAAPDDLFADEPAPGEAPLWGSAGGPLA